MQRALHSNSIISDDLYLKQTITRASSLSLGKERAERVASAGEAVTVGVVFCGRYAFGC